MAIFVLIAVTFRPLDVWLFLYFSGCLSMLATFVFGTRSTTDQTHAQRALLIAENLLTAPHNSALAKKELKSKISIAKQEQMPEVQQHKGAREPLHGEAEIEMREQPESINNVTTKLTQNGYGC